MADTIIKAKAHIDCEPFKERVYDVTKDSMQDAMILGYDIALIEIADAEKIGLKNYLKVSEKHGVIVGAYFEDVGSVVNCG